MKSKWKFLWFLNLLFKIFNKIPIIYLLFIGSSMKVKVPDSALRKGQPWLYIQTQGWEAGEQPGRKGYGDSGG